MTPVFERAKPVHVFDRVNTVMRSVDEEHDRILLQSSTVVGNMHKQCLKTKQISLLA
jgi:hypothetical protein